MRHTTLLLCALLACTLPLPARALGEQDIAALISLRPSVLKVEASDVRGNVGVGTGVAVAPGIIATACHVTAHATTLRVVSNGERMQVSGQRAQVARDLCLLEVPGASQVPPVPLRETPLRAGEDLVALGYILGAAPRVSNGTVLRLHDHDGGKVIQSTTPFTSGASGGGLFDRDGRLVGLMAFKFRAGTDNQFSVPAAWIADALRLPPGPEVAPLAGRAFWDTPEEGLPPFLQIVRMTAELRWPELEGLAQRWISTDPSNASAWHALGNAQAGTGRSREALASFERAHALESDNPVFLSDLALARHRQHDTPGYLAARTELERVAPSALPALDARTQACSSGTPHPC